jgi:DNA-binding MarR family transcriptional regulator
MGRREAQLAIIRDRFQELVPRIVLLHERVAKDVGLNGVELQVLHILFLAGEPLSPSELSERAELPRSSMTRVLAGIERGGYVHRSPVPEDGRRVLVHINPDRTAELSARFDDYARAMDAIGSRFTAEELTVVARYWGAFRDEIAGGQADSPRAGT